LKTYKYRMKILLSKQTLHFVVKVEVQCRSVPEVFAIKRVSETNELTIKTLEKSLFN